jgi:hypothetical protein
MPSQQGAAKRKLHRMTIAAGRLGWRWTMVGTFE